MPRHGTSTVPRHALGRGIVPRHAPGRGIVPRHVLGRGFMPRHALGQGTVPMQGTKRRHHGKGTRGMLATWGECPSIGLGGRGKAAWSLRQRVDKDCMGELATGSLSGCIGNWMSRAWGVAYENTHATSGMGVCMPGAARKAACLGRGTMPKQGTKLRHHA